MIYGTQTLPLHSLCTTFPANPDREIVRDHILDTYKSAFSRSAPILVIEGQQGTGKTTLLSQFARRYSDRCISSFVPPAQRASYSHETLTRDYSAQLFALLYPRHAHTPDDGNDGILESLIQKLKRRHGSDKHYFLLDGITEIPDQLMMNEVARMLPVGHGFRVIVSGDTGRLPPDIIDSQRTRPTLAMNLSYSEVQDYFSDLGLRARDIEQVYQRCGRGIPVILASVRRSLLAGADLHPLLSTSMDHLFEQEWQHAVTDALSEQIVATLAHSRHQLTVASLSECLSISDEITSDRLRDITFLSIDTNTSHVSFVSSQFAEFAAERMAHTKDHVISILVNHFSSRRTSDEYEYADFVPDYLHESNRLRELLSFLSPDYFSNVLEVNGSFSPLQKQFTIGIDASARLRRYGDLVRFALGSSSLREISKAQVSRSELEALVTIERGSEALALATNCPLREDRLHLLAVVARSEKERGTPVGSEVLAQIRQLYSHIDANALGDKAFDIAADLFSCCPDIAMELIEQSSGVTEDANKLDIAYVRLSIATAMRQVTADTEGDELEKIRRRIKNPRLRGFTAALSGETQTGAEVMSEVEAFESAADKLYVLRKWALEHADRDDALDVTENGLNTLVHATEYSPNIRVLRELSTPLAKAQNTQRAQSLVRTFDALRSTVDHPGPTEEIVRLNLNLATAESLYDMDVAAERLIDVYYTLSDLVDLSTKSSCIARLLSTLRAVDASREIEDRHGLADLSDKGLDESISELLRGTAEQADVIRRTIDALAFDVGRAFAVASRLNTTARREEALLSAVDAVLEGGSDIDGLKQIRSAWDRLQRPASKDRVAAAVAEHLVRHATGGDPTLLPLAVQIFRDVFFDVSDPIERCRVLCLLHALHDAGHFTNEQAAPAQIQTQVSDALEQLEPGWIKMEAGFRVARSFADRHRTVAERFLQSAEAERNATAFGSYSSEWTYQACLRLGIRAFAGQLGHGYDPSEDMSRIRRLIDRLPSKSLRAQLWGELAMHLFLQKHSDQAHQVVDDHVNPLLTLMPDGPAKVSALIAVAPAIYRSHKTTALQMFNAIDSYDRDAALITCAEFILERHIPSDPYERHDNGYEVSYSEAVDVLELAGEISRDNLVYVLIVAVADTLSSARFSKTFTSQQRSTIAESIEKLADRKFPDPNNIEHNGYVIASRAQLLRIDRANRHSWMDTIDQAREIPNLSDRAFVLAIIGRITRDSDLRDRLFDEAIEVVEAIPCTYDRLERFNNLAEMMARKSAALAKKCLLRATSSFKNGEGDEGMHIVREMIDTAFKFDEELAASLASIADDDPARAVARHEMRRRLETLRVKKAIVNGPETWDEFHVEGSDLSRSAWLALGSLNAGRANTVGMDQLMPALQAAGRHSLRDGCNIVAWVIENAVRRFQGTPQSRSTIRLMFEGCVQATELTVFAAANASVAVRRGTSTIASGPKDMRVIIRGGERGRAERFLTDWLERSASGHIYICDQYFGPAELDLLKLVQSVVPGIDVSVLTSINHHRQRDVVALGESYRTGWQTISDQIPPRAEIVLVGFEASGKSPIHDRSILTERSGLDIGTSWNSLGLSQDSTISVLTQGETSDLSDRVREFLVDRRREYGGERLVYESVTL